MLLSNLVYEIIDVVLSQKRFARISAQELLKKSHDLARTILSKVPETEKDRMRLYLVRYSIICEAIAGELKKKKVENLLVSLQAIQNETYLTPLIVSEILEACETMVHGKKRLIRQRVRQIYDTNDKGQLEDADAEYIHIDVLEVSSDSIDLRLLEEEGIDGGEDFLELIARPAPQHGTALDILFENGYAVPITHDFARFHTSRPTRYDGKGTKLSAILEKIQIARNFELADKNKIWYPRKRYLFMIDFNFFDEVKLLEKHVDTYQRLSSSAGGLQELLGYRFQHYFDFLSGMPYRSRQTLAAIRSASILHPPSGTESYDLRSVQPDTSTHLFGILLVPEGKVNDFIWSLRRNQISFAKPKKVLEAAEQCWSSANQKAQLIHEPSDSSLADLATACLFKLQARIDQILQQATSLEERRVEVRKSGISVCDGFILNSLIQNEATPDTHPPIKAVKEQKVVWPTIGQVFQARCVHYHKQKDASVFLERYVTNDEEGNVICKSCGELLRILGWIAPDVSSGEYVMTSSPTNTPVKERREYAGITGLVDDLDRFLQLRLSRVLQLSWLYGADAQSTSNRNQILDRVLQLIHAHHEGSSDTAFSLFEFPLLLRDDTFKPMTDINAYNCVLLYLTIIVLMSLSQSDIISISRIRYCRVDFFVKNKAFFESLELPGVRLSSLPVLCFLLCHSSCLLYHFGLFMDPEKKKPQALKSMLITMVEILRLAISGTTTIEKIIQGRFRLSRKDYASQQLVDIILNVKRYDADKPAKKASRTPRSRLLYILRTLTEIGPPVTRLYPTGFSEWSGRRPDSIGSVKHPGFLSIQHTPWGKPLRAKRLSSAEADKGIKNLSKALGSPFESDRAIVNHEYNGVPRTQPLIISWDTLKAQKFEDTHCLVLEVALPRKSGRVSVFYHHERLQLLGYQSGSSLVRYAGPTPVYLKFLPSAATRLRHLFGSPEPPTDSEIVFTLIELYPDMGREDAIWCLREKRQKERIKRSTDEVMLRKKACHDKQIDLSFFELRRLLARDGCVTQSKNLLDLIQKCVRKASEEHNSFLVKTLESALPVVVKKEANDRLVERMLYAKEFSQISSPEEEPPEDDGEESFIDDLDMENKLFEES